MKNPTRRRNSTDQTQLITDELQGTQKHQRNQIHLVK